ncbi:hypothetical protein [Amorphus sp. MBR-141]
MKVYTYQIGDGDGRSISALSHSETLGASDLNAAIAQAIAITKGRSSDKNENTIRLLEETGEDSIPVWVRPRSSIE